MSYSHFTNTRNTDTSHPRCNSALQIQDKKSLYSVPHVLQSLLKLLICQFLPFKLICKTFPIFLLEYVLSVLCSVWWIETYTVYLAELLHEHTILGFVGSVTAVPKRMFAYIIVIIYNPHSNFYQISVEHFHKISSVTWSISLHSSI